MSDVDDGRGGIFRRVTVPEEFVYFVCLLGRVSEHLSRSLHLDTQIHSHTLVRSLL